MTVIVSASKAFRILTDGSEARKTGLEKELIFVWVVHGGIPIYFCVTLQDSNECGGADTNNLKLAIGMVFNDDGGLVKITKNMYDCHMILSIADAAYMHFWKYSELLAQQKESLPWLIAI